jgi:LPPG:FO 2-phospho-L-lactate transferase
MKIVALAGGVGGAKLIHGLSKCLPPENLTAIVNTGDDFEHYGLYICPDLDTVWYTLAGISNNTTGWGRDEETWNILGNIVTLHGIDWFRLGDKDISTHLERTRRMKEGEVLSEIIKHFCACWGISQRILPMTNDRVPTIVITQDQGEMAFQDYFVKARCYPKVKGFRYENSKMAHPAPLVIDSIRKADFVIICPSNPWVSIGPILSIPDVENEISKKPIIAVSPIIQGKAIKGPAAKMYEEMGITPSALSVARHYKNLLTGFVYDTIDCGEEREISHMGIITKSANTLMNSGLDRIELANEVIKFCEHL